MKNLLQKSQAGMGRAAALLTLALALNLSLARAADGDLFTNAASVTADNKDTNVANNVAGASGTVNLPLTTVTNATYASADNADTVVANNGAAKGMIVSPALSAAATTPPGDVGTSYTGGSVTPTGGTGPYTYTSTALPPGLTLNSATGVISGTPTTAGTTSVTYTITDLLGATATVTKPLVINPALGGAATSPPGDAGTPYSGGQVTSTGGTGPYTYTSTALPPGLTLDPNTGVISGTPTTPGTTSVTFTITDGAGGTKTITQPIVINPTLSGTAATPAGDVGTSYSGGQVTPTGGTGPYTYASTALPGGLTLNPNTGAITGTPTTAGTTSVTYTITDAVGATKTITQPLVINVALNGTATTPAGDVGTPYAGGQVTPVGGTSPYAFASTALPDGLALNPSTGAITGTPTTAGTTSVTFTITDSAGATKVITQPITINPTLGGSATTPPGDVGTPYTGGSVTPTGGTGPYGYTSTTLPGGLTLNPTTGVISGTPTTTGTTSVTYTITDAVGATKTITQPLVINPALGGTAATPPGNVGTTYTGGSVTPTGGTGPYSYTSTTLPGGLTLNPTTGVISGTPTTAGTTSVTYTITDAAGATKTITQPLVINTALNGTATTPPGDAGTPYTGQVTGVSGTGPYAYTSTTLPPGLTLNPTTGVISGTPTTPGTTSVTYTITDAAGATKTITQPLVINPPLNGTATTPPGDAGTPYTGQITGIDGTGPYNYTSTTLPPGLTLNPTTGVISGTPTTPGTTSVTYTITDAAGGTKTITQNIVVNPTLDGTATTPQGTTLIPYSGQVTGTGGTAPYTYTSTTLPPGLTLDSATGAISGTPTTQGTTSVTFTITDAAGGTKTITQPIVIVSPFQQWQQNTPGGGDDPGGGGHPGSDGTATSNKDYDRLTDLQEYAFGSDPATGVPVVQGNGGSVVAGDTGLKVTQNSGAYDVSYRRPIGGRSDITYTLQQSTDLATWTNVIASPMISNNLDGTETVTWPALGAAGTTGFVRMKLTLAAPATTQYTWVDGWQSVSVQGQYQSVAHNLVKKPVYSDTVFTASGSTLSPYSLDARDLRTYMDPNKSYYVEVSNGAEAGQRWDVNYAASTANSIALNLGSVNNTSNTLPGDLVGSQFLLREHVTLNDLMPKASFTGAGSASAADQVQIWNGSVWVTYFLLDLRAGDPNSTFYYWTKTGGIINWDGLVIPPDMAVMAKHASSSGSSTISQTGEVRANRFRFSVAMGTSFHANGYPLNDTPASRTYTVANGFVGARTASQADQIQNWTGDTTPNSSDYTTYWLFNGGAPASQLWVPAGSFVSNNNNPILKAGRGHFIKRTNPTAPVLPLTETIPWTPAAALPPSPY